MPEPTLRTVSDASEAPDNSGTGTRTPKKVRLPVAPLIRVAGGWTQVARALGYDDYKHLAKSSNVGRWGRNGLTWATADRLACALNLHPMEVWGDDWLTCDGPALLGFAPRLRREPRWGLIGAELKAAS